MGGSRSWRRFAVPVARAYVSLEHAWPGDVEVDGGEVVAVPPL
jgi:hypothetical protein